MLKRFWHWFWGHPAYPRPVDGPERCGCGAMLLSWSQKDPNTTQSDVAAKAQDVDKFDAGRAG